MKEAFETGQVPLRLRSNTTTFPSWIATTIFRSRGIEKSTPKSGQKSRGRQGPQTPEEVDELRPLVMELVAVQKQARSLGLFVEDRELLKCPRCALQEDVAVDGRLMTYRADGFMVDTGLRFKKARGGKFHCPSCGCFVAEPTVEEIEKELGDGR